MLTYDEINSLALNFICGNVSQICRLCFSSTVTKKVHLEDSISVSTTYGDENITYSKMFSDLGVTSETLLPQMLCENCALTTVKSYVFFKLYQYSTEKWNAILNIVNDNLDKSSNQKQDIQSIFLIINKTENILFQSRSQCVKKNKRVALMKFRGIVNRHRSLKKKETTLNVACSFCNKTFNNLIILMKHMKEHNRLSHPCTHCPKKFSNAFLLKEHEERMHNLKLLKCNQCTEKFSTHRQLKLHLRFYHVEVSCNICLLKFKSRKELRPHLNNHSLLECGMCQKKFKNRQTYKRHIKTCNKDNQLQFICDICNKIYAHKSTLRTHISTDHDFGQALTCQWCNKKFDALSKLKSHVVKHTKEKNFQCDICGGKFVSKPALLYHTRLHTGETPYPCDLCGQSFLSASRRMAHKKRKHFGPTEECHICNTKFFTGFQLRKHVQRHSNPHSKLYVANDEE
ncbi:zinc finger protein 652-like [Zerene cesonia]|uniref:zinc finger protein 652-like n=1 Tax=Zerene cesonia TaxID=33412 RepID=UPI0018E5248D|nr:zinc finger protein 652-like [Zerene cesonia]